MASASDGQLYMAADATPAATTELEKAFDFQPAEITYSTSSSEYYGSAINSRTSSLSEASFKIFLDDGVTDAIIAAAGEQRGFVFYPDRNTTSKSITTVGYVSIQRTFPVGDQMQADVVIAADSASTNVSS